MLGNCGTCVRGNQKVTTPLCVICRRVEEQGGGKFTQYESKESGNGK